MTRALLTLLISSMAVFVAPAFAYTHTVIIDNINFNPAYFDIGSKPSVPIIYDTGDLNVVAQQYCPLEVVNGSPLIPEGTKCRVVNTSASGNMKYRRYTCSEGLVPDPNTTSGCIEPAPPPLECGENETEDPITGECVCSDGYSEDPETGVCGINDPEEPQQCTDNDTCLAEAQGQCAAQGQQLMNFEYFGGGQYGSSCGLQNNDCPSGQAWNAPTQTCINDMDSDGTPDPFDPDPDDDTVTGDSDSDGVPDEQDSHPDDPNIWNDWQNNYDGVITNPNTGVNPIGPSTEFDDSAIVEGLNQVIDNTNQTNKQLDEIAEIGTAGNDLQAGTNDHLQGVQDQLAGISEDLEPVDGSAVTNEVLDLFNKSSEELGIPEIKESDSQFINDGFNVFKNAQCVDPVFDGHTLELCQHQSRIVPIAEFIIWIGTLLFCWNETHRVLRRQS